MFDRAKFGLYLTTTAEINLVLTLNDPNQILGCGFPVCNCPVMFNNRDEVN